LAQGPSVLGLRTKGKGLRTGKHVPPDIKHHRVPAPELSFTRPNLPVLIAEIERDLLCLR